MRIFQKQGDQNSRSAHEADIAAACGPGVTGRVCGAQCTLTCSVCGSSQCQCMCAPACENAGRMLSSEPEKLPIEPAIVPLVFALKKSGLFHPCWSCEGHLGVDGRLWKRPQVWFYCESPVHLRLLAELLQTLVIRKRLSCRWSVSVTHSDPDNPEPTFAMHPVEIEGAAAELALLQADALVISEAIAGDLTKTARNLKASMSAGKRA